jgi:hypothetical protein
MLIEAFQNLCHAGSFATIWGGNEIAQPLAWACRLAKKAANVCKCERNGGMGVYLMKHT